MKFDHYRETWGVFYWGVLQEFAHSKEAAQAIYEEDYATMGKPEHFEILRVTPVGEAA